MVVYSARRLSQHDAHDHYWKLRNYDEYTGDRVRTVLRSKGFIGSHAPNRLRLKRLLSRHDRGLMPYHLCKLKDLKQICEQRELPLPPATRPKKGQLIDILETADDEATFDHFMDLPPELRVFIYTFYFDDMPHLEQPAQPPITKISHLIRQECLPIFYSRCTFTLNLDKNEPEDDGDWDDTLYGSEYPEIKGDFFKDTPDRYLRTVQKLCMKETVFDLRHFKVKVRPRKAWLQFGSKPSTNYDVLYSPRLAEMLEKHLGRMRARGPKLELTKPDVAKFKELFKKVPNIT